MALTRPHLDELRQEELRPVRVRPAGGRRPIRRWLTERDTVGRQWTAAVGLSWVVALVAGAAMRPPADEPAAAATLGATLVAMALLAGFAGLGLALARAQRAGLVASVVGAGLLLLDTVVCPLSGHHHGVGAWWYGQMAGFTALIGLSLAALRASGRRSATAR